MASSIVLNDGAPAHAQESLPSLPSYSQTDTALTAHLASRFHVHLPTAKLSSHALIAINDYATPSRGANGAKEGSAIAATEQLASRAWARLGARGENQAVVFLGESGSGKTTLRSHFLSSMLSFSSTPLSAKLSYAAYIFDSLTTTKSVTTPTASKAGMLYELQYDISSSSDPTLIGGKLVDHRLERSRIASVPTGERSFHILYYLLAGTSAAEKTHLGLDNAGLVSADTRASYHDHASVGGQKRWRYLGHPTQLKVGVNDADGFQQFKAALRKLEFPRNDIAEICQILASILHIGQLEFITTKSTTPTADDSGGYSHEGGEDITAIKNKDTLEVIAAFLGVNAQELEMCLGYRTQTLHRERVTVMLDPRGARQNADDLARTLYALLCTYIFETVNQKTCASEESVGNTVSIVDFPGFAPAQATGCALEQLLSNAANESLYNFCLQSFFERKTELLETEELEVDQTTYFDNSDTVKGLLKPGNGLLAILDDQMKREKTDMQFLEAIRKRFNGKNPAIEVGEATATIPGSNFATPNERASFTVKHYAGEVEYPVNGLLEENGDVVSGELMNLISSTKSDFVRTLFGQEALQTVYHPQEKTAIVQATVSSKPTRQPSVARRTRTIKAARPELFGDNAETPTEEQEDILGNIHPKQTTKRTNAEKSSGQGAAAEFLSSMGNVTKSLSSPNTNTYFVFCLKPNDRRIANQFDSKCVRSQLQVFGIAELCQRVQSVDYSIFLPFGEFLGLVEAENLFVGSEKDKVESILDEKRWPFNEARAGSTGVFLSERIWASLARISDEPVPQTRNLNMSQYGTPNKLGVGDSTTRLLPGNSPAYNDDKAGAYFESREVDSKSETGFAAGDMFRGHETRAEMAVKGNEKKMEEVDQLPLSGSRKRWLFLVYLLTFYIPDFAIRLIGGVKRKDVRVAWREKLAINLLIWLSCGFVVFFIVIFPELICPRQLVFSSAELSSYNGQGSEAYVSIRGVVFDLGAFLPAHYPSIIPDSALLKYAGKDASGLFPVQVSAMCQGVNGEIPLPVQVNWQGTNYSSSRSQSINSVDTNAQYHDFRWANGEADYRRDWYTEQMLNLEKFYFKGRVGFPPSYLQKLASQDNYIAYINNRVYDMTSYIASPAPARYPPSYGGNNRSQVIAGAQFMDADLVRLFSQHSGQDLTSYWMALSKSQDIRDRMQLCLDNLFYVGDLDTRNSAQCLFARYILLAISVLLASVIGFKFLAALQFGKRNVPENLDKFIICTVPTYTEDEESLRRAIDSAARMRYDDKRKLLVILCDGMIIGQGNDRPTPRIVLDILGVPETIDPEPLSFESLGEGLRQHNMGKVYSGLYEVQGHIVPFLVIVKVGKPSEVQKPGNRGKRDSQMIIMRFLNRVHYNLPMTPMELEMHHQIRNIIGVNPTFYEFLLQIDADTVVAPDSATRMVAAFLHDTRIIGVCGETALTNAKASFVTMMQVYEYYISHNLTKAFESLFGSVTCLPGCFSMYRIRAAETGKPLFVSREVVEAYSEIRVDTLHMKNLLHLGEDRYLTTLLLKFHSKYKTKYIFRAHAWTIAPDSWQVFLSQRRRWINSTVHNLIELIPLQQLCGFCCFSMRFVVFLDLLSTIVQPVIVGYIVYLIVLISQNTSVIPITAFILLGAIYGLQAIIFILRRKWEMIGWMLIYVIATPIFALALPLYSFWNMDDFSWGNTRVVTGEKGKQIVVSDEGKFDPRSIPRKRWEEYQAELWDAQTENNDEETKSIHSGISYGTRTHRSEYQSQFAPSNSEYAAYPVTHYGSNPPSRPLSRYDMPPRYPSQMSMPMLPTGTPGVMGTPQPHLSMATGYEMSELGYGAATPGAMPTAAIGAPGSMHGPGQPSDDALLAEIRDILSKADLMTVTKKSVKAELERRFGVSLESRRMYISSATEAVLSGQL